MATLFNLSSLKMLTLPLAIAAVTIFSGCATTASPEARLTYDKTQQNLKSQSVSVISDGCLIRVEMGKNDVLYEQSNLTSLAMMATVEEALSERSLKVSRTTAPFVCGALSKEALAKMDILANANAKDELNTAYPLLSSTNNLSQATNQKYLTLLEAFAQDKRKEIDQAKGNSVNLGLDKTTLETLREIEGTDKVFVSMVTGSKPSFGYSMAMGVTTAVATGGTGFATPQQGQFHHLYLVDLTTNTVDWAKSTAFNGQVFKMPVNERLSYKGMLTPLYAE